MQRATQHLTMSSPRFVGYLIAQFLGALNDNAFKLTLVLFGLERMQGAAAEIAFSSLVTALFPLPWLVLSQWAGYLADRYRKDRVLLATKLPEIVFMGLGALGFYLGNLPFLLVVFLLMSAQSASLSPAKYGILPEVLGNEDLAQANGLLSMTTNVAVLLGTVLGVEMFGLFYPNLAWAGVVYVGLAVLGFVAMLRIPVAPAGHEAAHRPRAPVRQIRDDLRALRRVPSLSPTVLGLAYFSFLGSLLLAVIPVYGTSALGLSTDAAGRLLVPLVIGLAVGSLLAGWLSRGRVELGLVPLGSLFMALFSVDLLVRGTASEAELAGLPLVPLVDFLFMGFGAALFNVPLNALLQQRAPEAQKGQLIGFSNVVSNVAILAAAGCGYALTLFEGFDVRYTLVALSVVVIAGTLHIVWLLPDFLARVVVYVLVNVLYRLRIVGAEHIPRSGALFVANHVSWIDAVLVAAASGRMVRFMMFRPFYEARPFHVLFRRLHAIPVETGGSREANERSLALARAEIEAGHTVCIFAEGAITRTGQLLGFRRGLERIMDGLAAPIIPVCLDGLWGSVFSFEGGRVLLKRPRRFRHPIQVLFGPPLPSTATAFEVRRAVQALSVDAVHLREREFRVLPVELLRSARRHFFRAFLADAGGTWTYGQVVRAALALRATLVARGIEPGEAVGIRAPTDARSAVTGLALLLTGALPVYLPPSGEAQARSALRGAGGRRILVSDPGSGGDRSDDLEEVPLPEPRELLAPATRAVDLVRAVALLALPASWLARAWLGLDPRAVRSPAVIVFSRGTSGPIKAILLTHLNVLSNLRAFRQIFDVGPEDGVLGVLSFSSGFGFTGTLCLPFYAGARVALHPDPFDVPGIERLCRAQQPTLVFAPPPVLACYARALPREALASLRNAVTGGQALDPEIARAFRDRFGIEPLEGYGTSECAPLISLNIPDVQGGSSAQPGSQPGTVGHPLPGVAVSVRDPRSLKDLPPDHAGDLWVRGPNVMAGYVGDTTTLEDGWYPTGDVASLDSSGFLTLIDRRERIVPHPEGDIPPRTR